MKCGDSGNRLPLCKWKMKVVDVEVQNIELMRLPKDEFEQTNVVRRMSNGRRLIVDNAPMRNLLPPFLLLASRSARSLRNAFLT